MFNNFYGNQENIRLATSQNLNATYNWWGTTDVQAINQSIYDFKNDFSLGVVTFIPFLNSPANQTLPYTVHNLNTGLSYSSIQTAIDASQTLSGHAILVDSGTYFENINITKAIYLIGEDVQSTIIDGRLNSEESVVAIQANNVTVMGFTIQGFNRIGCSMDGNNTCILGNDIVGLVP
jgi:hypothetical protein